MGGIVADPKDVVVAGALIEHAPTVRRSRERLVHHAGCGLEEGRHPMLQLLKRVEGRLDEIESVEKRRQLLTGCQAL
jgi:hypothetical protein